MDGNRTAHTGPKPCGPTRGPDSGKCAKVRGRSYRTAGLKRPDSGDLVPANINLSLQANYICRRLSIPYLIKASIYGCDIIKAIIFFLIFLVGLASAYAAEQQTALNGTTLNATTLNATALNATALNETALNETALNKTALNETALNETALNETALNETALNETALNETALNETTPKELTIIPVSSQLKNPFKAGTELSKFGRKQVYNL